MFTKEEKQQIAQQIANQYTPAPNKPGWLEQFTLNVQECIVTGVLTTASQASLNKLHKMQAITTNTSFAKWDADFTKSLPKMLGDYLSYHRSPKVVNIQVGKTSYSILNHAIPKFAKKVGVDLNNLPAPTTQETTQETMTMRYTLKQAQSKIPYQITKTSKGYEVYDTHSFSNPMRRTFTTLLSLVNAYDRSELLETGTFENTQETTEVSNTEATLVDVITNALNSDSYKQLQTAHKLAKAAGYFMGGVKGNAPKADLVNALMGVLAHETKEHFTVVTPKLEQPTEVSSNQENLASIGMDGWLESTTQFNLECEKQKAQQLADDIADVGEADSMMTGNDDSFWSTIAPDHVFTTETITNSEHESYYDDSKEQSVVGLEFTYKGTPYTVTRYDGYLYYLTSPYLSDTISVTSELLGRMTGIEVSSEPQVITGWDVVEPSEHESYYDDSKEQRAHLSKAYGFNGSYTLKPAPRRVSRRASRFMSYLNAA